MSRALNVLFVEPPAARRVGGIETALAGMAGSLPAAGVQITRIVDVTPADLAQADVVHFHGIWETAHHRVRAQCVQAQKPFLVSPHGMLEDWAFRHRGWKKRPYFYFVERRSIGRARVVLATSEDEATTLRRWFSSSQVQVLPLGALGVPVPDYRDARKQLVWPDEEFVVLFLSRCHEKKGLHLLVAAAPELARTTTRRIHVVIVGDGEASYVDPLRQASAGWTGNLRATWVGACWGDAKWDYFAGADLMCLPSFSENFGLAVLESLLAGTPVLTTPATPWASLRGELPVFLTDPKVSHLASALETRVAAPPRSAADRAHTRQLAAATFDWSVLAPRYAEMYRQVAARL